MVEFWESILGVHKARSIAVGHLNDDRQMTKCVVFGLVPEKSVKINCIYWVLNSRLDTRSIIHKIIEYIFLNKKNPLLKTYFYLICFENNNTK